MNAKTIFVLCTLTAAAAAQASIIGHWRFESGAFLSDSSGNGLTLTNVGSMNQVAIPGSGNGSDFPAIISRTGASNGSAADFTATSGVSGFSAADSAPFDLISTNAAFTIEAFINSGDDANSPEDSRYIASQYNSSAGDRSFAYQVNAQDGFTVFLGGAGGGFVGRLESSGGLLDANKDYFVAVSYDAATNDGVFYWQNLSDGGALMSEIVLNTDSRYDGSVGDSAQPFTIGYRPDSDKRWNADGFIDEVRLHSMAVGESDLLVAPIPEPSAVILMVAGLSGLLAILRRRAR